MTSRKRIQKYEKFGLQLTEAERKLIVDGVPSLPQEIAEAIHAAPANQPITMILSDWKDLAWIPKRANPANKIARMDKHN